MKKQSQRPRELNRSRNQPGAQLQENHDVTETRKNSSYLKFFLNLGDL